ncbi:MAG TPA: MFS transporter [Xanthobacteraceae bacterium]
MARSLAMNAKTATSRFPGWSVAWAAFAIAAFSWGIGFYGPSVFLQTLHLTRGWPIAIISSAITVHFLLSALIITYLPEIHRSWGIASTTTVGALLSAGGVLAWSGAWQPWQIFGAAGMSGAGWAMTSGAALNAMIARWFERERPRALSLAFNGASVGGIVFVALWIALIAKFGFLAAATLIGSSTLIVTPALAYRFLRHNPNDYGLNPDGDVVHSAPKKAAPARPRAALMWEQRFLTHSAAFALGLFVQIGLFAHLIARSAPVIGTTASGAAVSVATLCAVIGRIAMGHSLGIRDRSVAAAANFAVQCTGILLLALGANPFAQWLGCILFGLGVGNLTTLPPLIAQQEFNRADAVVVVALVIAINQAIFAFAPAVFGVLRQVTESYEVPFLLAGRSSVPLPG